MLIGQLSRRTGIRASALRYYEELGILPPAARRSGRRIYGDAALDRIAFVQFARACGFRLEEIAVLLGAGPARDPVSARWRGLAATKMVEIDKLIARAQGMKQFLRAAPDCQCVTADACGRIVRDQMTSRAEVVAPSRLATGTGRSGSSATARGASTGSRSPAGPR